MLILHFKSFLSLSPLSSIAEDWNNSSLDGRSVSMLKGPILIKYKMPSLFNCNLTFLIKKAKDFVGYLIYHIILVNLTKLKKKKSASLFV